MYLRLLNQVLVKACPNAADAIKKIMNGDTSPVVGCIAIVSPVVRCRGADAGAHVGR